MSIGEMVGSYGANQLSDYKSTYYTYNNGVQIRSSVGAPQTGLFGPQPIAVQTYDQVTGSDSKKWLTYALLGVLGYFLAKEVF